MSEEINLDELFAVAARSEREDPDCWYDTDSLDLDSIADERFVAAVSPRVVFALIRRVRELGDELTYAATVCESRDIALASTKHWRELLAKGTTR